MTACEHGARITADVLPPHRIRQIERSDADSGSQTDPLKSKAS